MDCRTSALLFVLLGSVAGCITTDSAKTTSASSPPPPPADSAPSWPSRAEEKRTFQPGTIVAMGLMKEKEAEQHAHQPEVKAKILDKARLDYQEALRQDPNHLSAYRGLGRVYLNLGDYDHALETYKKALARFPQDATVWVDLAMLYNRKKDFAEGIRCLNKARELDPENRQIMMTLGLTQARAGQAEQSLATLTRAVGSAAAHYNLARMYLHRREEAPARQHLQMALQANPNLEGARELLARLDTGDGHVTVNFQTTE